MGHQSLTEEEHLSLAGGFTGFWKHAELTGNLDEHSSGPVAATAYFYEKTYNENYL
jgi:hypothetical protein